MRDYKAIAQVRERIRNERVSVSGAMHCNVGILTRLIRAEIELGWGLELRGGGVAN